MNLNKKNHYVENIGLKETVNNQKLIIARLEKEINIKSKTIDYLTQQLVNHDNNSNKNSLGDLITFD